MILSKWHSPTVKFHKTLEHVRRHGVCFRPMGFALCLEGSEEYAPHFCLRHTKKIPKQSTEYTEMAMLSS